MSKRNRPDDSSQPNSTSQPDLASQQDREFEMLIEIPSGSNIKYEIKDGKKIVDRVLHTPMKYPFNYGFFPNTLADDQDELDVALLNVETPFDSGSYIKVRIIGGLWTKDEKGVDEKIFAVPANCVDPKYREIRDFTDLGSQYLEQVKFFFANYKKLEPNKTIEVGDFLTREEALQVYEESYKRKNPPITYPSSPKSHTNYPDNSNMVYY